MKMIFCFIALSLTVGCASVPSDYNQGCRDGITAFVEQGLHAGIEEAVVTKGCDGLDAQRSEKRAQQHEHLGHRP